MHYAWAMTDGLKRNIAPANALGWTCVFLLTAAYVTAIVHGVVSIDVARDLYWGQRIVLGEALPSIGPPIGTITLLGPVWYYLVAAVLAVSGSLTVYFLLMGCLVASKFALAYVVGKRWLGPAFGVSLAVAAAVPGVASYQLLGIGHPWFVEAALWWAAWCGLRLFDAPDQTRWAIGLGLAAALALHAHPTAVLLLPWALVVIVTLPSRHRWRALIVSGLAAFAVFSPWLLGTVFPALAAHGAADNAVGPSGIGGSIAGVSGIAPNVLWMQAKNIFDSLLRDSMMGSRLASLVWAAVLISTLIGIVMAGMTARLRRTLIGSLLSLGWTVAAVALLRNHTPFYMLFVALVPLSVVFAVAWVALLEGQTLWRRALWIFVIVAVVALHLVVAAGLIRIAGLGQVNSYLPLHSDMQDVSTTAHRESVLASTTRDALARWLCAQTVVVSLHGDIASAFDVGLHIETDLACRQQRRSDNVGGRHQPYVGLPISVWKQAGVQPTEVIGAYGLASANRVFSPTSSLPVASGKRYPPRFDLMLAAARQEEWSIVAPASSSDVVIVSNLLPTSPLFRVTAEVNGRLNGATTTFANTAIFRCTDCATGQVVWSFKIRGGLPQTVSIAIVAASKTPAKLTE